MEGNAAIEERLCCKRRRRKQHDAVKKDETNVAVKKKNEGVANMSETTGCWFQRVQRVVCCIWFVSVPSTTEQNRS